MLTTILSHPVLNSPSASTPAGSNREPRHALDIVKRGTGTNEIIAGSRHSVLCNCIIRRRLLETA
jgi:hypothetical protein